MKRNWEYKKLGDVASFRRGLTYAKDDVVNHSSKIVLRSNNINLETSSLNFDDVVCLRDDFVIPLDKLLRGGDIFICMSNGSTQHLGKVAHVQENLNMAFGGFMGVIEPNENLTNSRYVFYCCRSGAYRSYLNSIFNGANINNLKWSDLSKFVVPVPSLSEQSRIVAELDLLTGIIDKQNAQLKELDNLAQAIFYDMFGDPIENPKGWAFEKLENVCSNIVDCPHSTPKKVDYKTEYPCIRTSELKGGSISWTSMQYLEKEEYEIRIARLKPVAGDIVFGREGTIGDAVILPEGYNFSLGQRTMLLRANSALMLNHFLHSTLMSEWVKRQIDAVNVSSTVAHLNIKDFRQFNIPVPPLALQQSFAEKIQSIEKQKETIRASIADTQKLLDYTMGKYFG